MKVIVGTHNGQMKIVNLDENVQTDLFGKYGLSNAVETMTWASPDNEDLFAAGFSNGKVQFWNPVTRKLEHDCGQRNGKIKGLFTFETETERKVVTVTDNKQLEICPMVLPEEYKHTFTKLRGNDSSVIWKMRPNPISHQHIMYMGYHIMPTLYDFEKEKTVWMGEFGAPKFFGLKQKQFFTDFQFMPDSASVLITGSRYREFRIFDLREGKKPVMYYDVTKTSDWEFAMISLAVTEHTPTVVYATEATGKIASFDLRTGKLHRVYRDGMGTVKMLAFHPTERAMGAVSLDRYLRVYDIDKRLQKLNDKTSLEYRVRIAGTYGANMHNKLFLKQKLNSMLFFSEGRVKKVLAERAEEKENERQGKKRRIKRERDEEDDEDYSSEEEGMMEDVMPEEEEEEDEKDTSIITVGEDDELWGGLQKVGDVKAEDDSDDDMEMSFKDEPDSDDDVKPSKAKNGKSVKKEDSDDELLWDDDEEGEEDDIKLGEFNDDEEEVQEDGEDGEDEEDEEEEDDEEDEEEEGQASNGKPKGKQGDNKKTRRVAQEKLDKQKKIKQKKNNIKKDKLKAKKRKLLK